MKSNLAQPNNMLLTTLKVTMRELLEDHVFRWTARFILLIVIGTIVTLAFVWRLLPPELPLFYSLPWGEDQLAPPVMLFVLVGIMFGLFLVMSLLGAFIRPVSRYLMYVLIIGSSVAVFVVCITLIRIIILIT